MNEQGRLVNDKNLTDGWEKKEKRDWILKIYTKRDK